MARNVPAASTKHHATDKVLIDIANYVHDRRITSAEAYRIARYCLMDSLGCAAEAMGYPACTKLLGPLVPDTLVLNGSRVPGTQFQLDPVRAAFNIGTMIRWLDSNDTILAAERGHPSDNLGAILATADYVSRRRASEGKRPLVMRDVLTAMIKAHEIQGGISLKNSFTSIGLDHAILVRIASTAVATQLLGGSRAEILNAVSNAWADGAPMKVYRQAPNIGSRKSWAAGDASSRGVFLGLMALKGEMGIPTVLTARTYGFYDAIFRKPFSFERPYGSYVMENILFKMFPAEMMCQTAAECAFRLHPLVKDRLGEISRVTLSTQGPAMGIVSKTGPLNNPADRDHCIEYVTAVGLMYGSLSAHHFEDEVAADSRLEQLRAKVKAAENPRYTKDFYLPSKRSSANAIQVHFKDGTRTPLVEVEYPAGHPRRRKEGLRIIAAKFRTNIARHYPARQQDEIFALFRNDRRLDKMPVNEFMGKFVL